HGRGIVGNVDVLERISAEVVNEPAADAEKPPLCIGGDVERPVLIALLGGIGEMLAPVLEPFDRASQKLRGCHHGDVLGIDAQLRPKAAAYIRSDDPQGALVETQEKGQGLEEVMRLLGRGPYRHRLLGIAPVRNNSAGLDRMGAPAMLPKLLMEDMRG